MCHIVPIRINKKKKKNDMSKGYSYVMFQVVGGRLYSVNNKLTKKPYQNGK